MARSGENAAWGALSGIGAFSFQGTKNLTSGESGFITTNDEQLFELCCGLHTIGRGRGGGVYEHFYVGWNYRLSELQGSLLNVQFKRLEAQTELRQRRVERLLPRLSAVPGIRAQTLDSRVTRAACYVAILEFEPEAFAGVGRDSLAEALQGEGIPAGTPYHYALHWNPVFQQKNFPWVPGIATLDYSRVECPIADRLCRNTVFLPQYIPLGEEEDVDAGAEAFGKVQRNAGELKTARGPSLPR